MQTTIRNAEPRDIDAVFELMRRLSEHEGHTHFFELTREVLRRCCFDEPRRIELIVAESGEGIVGYATCLLQYSPWIGREYLFVDDLYVVDEMRGKGVGARLMREVGALALEKGVGVRWHVEMANGGAQKFYRSMGAELRDRLIAYWSPEAIRAFRASPAP